MTRYTHSKKAWRKAEAELYRGYEMATTRESIRNYKTFTTMDDAFDYCREVDHPVVVRVGLSLWHLFPSGKAEIIQRG